MNLSNNSQSLTEIKREQELASLSKIINPAFKGSLAGQALS